MRETSAPNPSQGKLPMLNLRSFKLALCTTTAALVAIFAGKKHLPQQAANLFVRGPGVPLMKPFEGGGPGLNQRLVILSEISHCSLVSPDDFSVGQK